MSFGIYVDMAINLVQQLMFVGFLNLFFERGKSKLKSVLSVVVTVILLFSVNTFFEVYYPKQKYFEIIITTVILLIYTICFLKGSIYMRSIVPVVIIGLNIVLANLSLTIMMHVTDIPFMSVASFPDTFKYLYIVISNIVFAFLMLNFLYFGKRKIELSDISQIVVFLLLAVVIYIAALSDLLLYEVSGFDKRILPYVIVLCVSVFALAGMYWFLLMKVSRDERLKTELLLSTQREEMYKNSVINTNAQIEKLSQTKHDMKNHIMSVSTLISNGDYESANKLCESVYEKLSIPALSCCKNPVLNAIINVEIEKASRHGIDFCYEVNYTLDFVEDSDIISLVGNICDNAVEYLSTIDESKRRMSLAVSSYKGYCYITCKNTIEKSVLSVNPQLSTTKNDSVNHGKGMKILTDVAKKYGGEVLFKEQEDELSVSVIIRKEK